MSALPPPPQRDALRAFVPGPQASLAFALLCGVLGLLFAGGWIERPPERAEVPGREWSMAVICWAMGAVFARAAWRGFRRGPRRR